MFSALKALLLAAVACAENTWGPADSVHALDGVIGAVERVVKLPNLTPAQLEEAKKMAADVKSSIEAVESGKLSKQQAHEKVGASLKELTAFEVELTKRSATKRSAVEERMAALTKQLAEKKDALAKAEKMMHLLNLKKKLMEKKLKLQKLLVAKDEAAKKDKSAAEEAANMGRLVKEVRSATAKWTESGTKTALAAVQAQEAAVSKGLASIDETQKKGDVMMDAALKGQLGSADKGDALAKGQAMLKELKKQEHRKLAKVRAMKQLEFKELKDVEAKIQRHDVAGLQQSLQNIEGQSKALQAKSGKFLY
jgi:hypothetical protein